MAENFTPRPELQGWPARTKITTFNIVHDEIIAEEFIIRKPAYVTGQDSYTPSSMDLCTPYRPNNLNMISRERTVSGSSFTNEIMVETPCQKQTSSNLAKIEEDFKRLSFGSPMESNACEDLIWYFCDQAIKGFRDPQVGLQGNST